VARDDLLGWAEAKPLKENTIKAVNRFLKRFIVLRFGIFTTLVVDGGAENQGFIDDLTIKYTI
jgi:hypothetical protein